MIVAPTNNVIVSVQSKWIREISEIVKVSHAENDSTIQPADVVQIVGNIESLPKTISPTNAYKGYSTKDLRVGDVVIFSYQVIFDMVTKGEDEEPCYKNMITYEGKEFFLADIKKIFAVIRDGEVVMVNGWVMLSEFEKSTIIIPNSAKKTKVAAFSIVLQIGNPRTHLRAITAKNGDIVFYNQNHAQKYELNGKKFIILSQEKILGKKK